MRTNIKSQAFLSLNPSLNCNFIEDHVYEPVIL